MIKSMKDYLGDEKKKLPKFHNLEGLKDLQEAIPFHQICLIFTNEDVGKINDITKQFIIEKQAKVGAPSPVEVIIPAGPTGMDSSQIDYFQALKIQTKVMKNQLEIVNPAKILVVGQKITLSEINLMKKFNIKPYRHFIKIIRVYTNGKLYDDKILSITNDHLKERVEKGIKNIASFGLATGITNKASAPYLIARTFKNILGMSVGCNVEISQAKGALQASKAPPKKEVKAEEPKKDEKGGKDKAAEKGGKDKGAEKGGKKGKEDTKKKEKEEVVHEDDTAGDGEDVGGFGSMFGM